MNELTDRQFAQLSDICRLIVMIRLGTVEFS